MDGELLKNILALVASGDLSIDSAFKKLTHFSIEDIDYAHIDHHRSLRKGFPEVIFGQGKTAAQISGIIERMRNVEYRVNWKGICGKTVLMKGICSA